MKKLITTGLAIIGALCILAFLLSCTTRSAESANEWAAKFVTRAGKTDVYEITLSDGTSCAVTTSRDPDRPGGITCNWKAQ